MLGRWKRILTTSTASSSDALLRDRGARGATDEIDPPRSALRSGRNNDDRRQTDVDVVLADGRDRGDGFLDVKAHRGDIQDGFRADVPVLADDRERLFRITHRRHRPGIVRIPHWRANFVRI